MSSKPSFLQISPTSITTNLIISNDFNVIIFKCCNIFYFDIRVNIQGSAEKLAVMRRLKVVPVE